MVGLVTEADLDLAEEEFPGIREVYDRMTEKPRTFLDLLAAYLSEV